MARRPSPDSRSHRGVAIKMDPRVLHLLNDLANWLDDYQYRIVMKVIAREVRRQKMTLPPHHQAELEEMEAELGLNPEETGRIKREVD